MQSAPVPNNEPSPLRSTFQRIGSLLPSGLTLSDEAWARRHQWLLALMALHVVGVAGFGLIMQHSAVAVLSESIFLAVCTALAALKGFGRRLRTSLVTIGLVGASTALVHLSGGYIEAHFHFFIILVFIALYHDRWPFLLSLGMTALHHGALGTVAPTMVYNHPAAIAHPWLWAGIHTVAILAECAGILTYWRLHEQDARELRQSEAFVTSVLEHLPDMVFVKDAKDLRFVRLNKAGEELLGFSRSELLGKTGHHLFPKDSADLFTAKDREVLASGCLQDIPEEPIHTQDKGMRTLHTKKIPIVDDAGRPRYLLGISEDITDRIQAETALRESEERHRLLVDQISDYAIIRLDRDGRITSWNSGSARIKGYCEEEILGQSMTCFYTPEDVAADKPAYLLRAALSQGRVEDEGWRVRKDGSLFWADVVISPLFNQSGELQGFSKITRDITESKQAVAELREQEARLRAIVDHAVDGIITIDGRGKIESFNPAAERLFGYPAAEVIGQNVKILMPEPYQSEHDGYLARYHKTREAKIIGTGREVVGLRKDGSTFPLDLSVSEIVLDNRRCFTGIVRDMTERKEAEHQLEQAAFEMECQNMELASLHDQVLAATKAKSEFLASMSHEIRTPMNAIIAMADLLQETPLSTEQQEYVGRFSRAASNLLELINDVLDLSKIEAGRLELEAVPFDLHQLMDEIGELMAARAHSKHLHLATFVHPDVPIWVQGDSTRLRQIIVNLVGNAIKFTDQGEVVIRIERDQADAGRLHCSVSDTGIGIPDDKVGKIFEGFAQVDSSTTRKYGGTGLGLSISKRLVELMRGEISVNSMEGLGSTFSFTAHLPETVPALNVPTLPAMDVDGLHLLIVDGSATTRLIIHEYLSRYRPVLVEAASGADALKALNTARQSDRPFDAVILDDHLPDMNGLDLAKMIQERLGSASTPLILQVSDMRGQILQRARELGIAGHVYKPVSRKRLLESLAKALRTVRASSAPHPPEPPASAKSSSADVTPLRILLTEDLEDNRAVVKLFLKDTPHLIDEAENGAIAVQKFQAGAYDLVLMDMQMPVMDGLEATSAIRSWERTQHRAPTPIVALTANALKEAIDKSLAAGCSAHLTKPIKKKTLLEAIAQYTNPPSDLAA